jgi:hypothetical protein
MGDVTVEDENGAALSGALVVAVWTLPDGGTFDQNAWTDEKGIASFATAPGPWGTYSLRIVNIVLSLHTFDPEHSVLRKSISSRR